ncbi:MAG: hypothetical protein PHI53_02045 [Candidatus Pacebacteria bacterium]|nr:hypothetical protein [Candidatus Paceibacterota bacterium]
MKLNNLILFLIISLFFISDICSAKMSMSFEVVPLEVKIGMPITINVRGYCPDCSKPLIKIGAYYQGVWHWDNVSDLYAQKSWTFTESLPAVYRYCAHINNGSDYVERCLSVDVCRDQCFNIGEARCSDNRNKQVCELKDDSPCIKWSDDELCTGDTSCGYGDCRDNQKPNWYCAEGECKYHCINDSSCENQNKSSESLYSKCGNNICDSNEDKNTCPSDCKEKIDIFSFLTNYWYFILFSLTIFIIYFFFKKYEKI